MLPAAGAAGTTAQPEPGPLSPAFVEALHDPLVTIGLGRLPEPRRGAAWARRPRPAPRAPAEPDVLQTSSTEGRLDARSRTRATYDTCWAFANIAALESKLLPRRAGHDFSEDNLVGRSGYGPFAVPARYAYGGYDFMAVAYFARWAGPLSRADDPYHTRTSERRPGPVRSTCRASS